MWDSGYDAALPPDLGIVDLNQVTCADSNDLLQVPRCAQQQHLYLGSEPEVPSEPTTLSPSPWIISDSMLVLEGAQLPMVCVSQASIRLRCFLFSFFQDFKHFLGEHSSRVV